MPEAEIHGAPDTPDQAPELDHMPPLTREELAARIEITVVREPDVELLQAIDEEANTRFISTGLIKYGPDGPVAPPASAFEAAAKEGLLFCASYLDDVVGFAFCRIEKPDLYLEQVSVLSDFGRIGIGGRLLQTCEAEARRRGREGVVVSTFRDVPWNGPFYRKHGFREMPAESLALWQMRIIEVQAETMDTRLRCFMRCKV